MGLTDVQTAQVQRQMKYYFSNSNIMEDAFLLEKVKSNADGWVDLAVLTTFNKLKSISDNIADIAAATKGVATLEVNEAGTAVRRKDALPEKWDPLPRSIYAKGFPVDETHESITDFFAQFGEVAKVQKRALPGQTPDGKRRFKSSVYVEFDSEEVAKKVLETGAEFKDVKLEMMTKEQHMKETIEKRGKFGAPKATGEKRKADDEEGEEPAAKRPKREAVVLPENASLKFTEVGEIDWKLVKDAIKDTGAVRFCVIENGSALVMFSTKDDRDKVAAKNTESAFVMGEVTPKACVCLEGAEEEKFRKEMETKINEMQASQGGKKGGKGGKGFKKGGKKGGKGFKGKGRK